MASAVGRIVEAETPTIAIAAKYAEAPACPTDEYSKAAKKNAIERISVSNISI